MAHTAEKFKLVVSGLIGRVWIAKTTKTPHSNPSLSRCHRH